jgi:hypothetical protein
LPIADCRLSIEEAVWQLPPLSISNRQSAIENHIDALWIEFGDRLWAGTEIAVSQTGWLK